MLFKYNPELLRDDIVTKGYAHLKDILSDDFVGQLKRFYSDSTRDSATESREWKITGKKRQFVFNFATPEDAQEFRDGLARLTDIPVDDFTISERHLKVYDAAANPFPAPHKDRNASHYSIGMPIHLTEGSSVCVFPDLEPGPNPNDKATFLSEDRDAQHPDFYRTDKAVLLNEKVGDVVIFLGSTLYHERVNAAGTAVLYIKANGVGADPLNENIYATGEGAVDA
jgi:hypothetical protein